MKFTEIEIERQRRANIEHELRSLIASVAGRLENAAEHPFSSQDEWRSWCEDLAEELWREV